MSRKRRWLLLLFLGSGTALLSLVAVGYFALTCRPAWYQPISIDYARLDEDKRLQIQIENQVSAKLNRAEPADVELDEATLNRWVAAREELFPGEVPSIEPIKRPQVILLDDNRLRFAGEVTESGVTTIASVEVEFEITEEYITIRWNSSKLGALPISRELIDDGIRKVVQGAGARIARLSPGELVIPNEGIWPNGNQPFRVEDLQIEAGRLRTKLGPLEAKIRRKLGGG